MEGWWGGTVGVDMRAHIQMYKLWSSSIVCLIQHLLVHTHTHVRTHKHTRTLTHTHTHTHTHIAANPTQSQTMQHNNIYTLDVIF